jgi:hypothetical protein
VKVPVTCAVCDYSRKFGGVLRNWHCRYDEKNHEGNFEIRRIPCLRGALPKPPAWCPLKAEKEAAR